MSTLLIIGGTGELGQMTVAAADKDDGSGWDGDIIATYHSSIPPKTSDRVRWESLDCSDHKAVRAFLMAPPSVGAVLYCAIPAGGNANAKHGDRLHNGIVDDVVHCAEAVAMLGVRFVAVSTDLVFDGQLPSGESYTEDSTTGPINPYGQYKSEMERRLLSISGNIAIARTSLILTFDPDNRDACGKGVRFIIDCIDGRHGKIELFTDEERNMSFSDDLGKALVELASPECNHRGLIHMVSDECTNRWHLAQLVAKRMNCEHLLGKYATNGLSKDSGLKNRPLNCRLSTKLRSSVLKTHIRGITERLG